MISIIILIITLLSLFVTHCSCIRPAYNSNLRMSADRQDVGLKRFFKKIGSTVTRICYDFNQGAALVANFPILFNHRCAEFNDIVRSGIDIDPVDGENWSYKDSVDKTEVKRVLDHVHYGRMVQSVYHLLNSDFDSGLYGQSVFGNETPAFIEKIFKGYKVVDILATTLDTPNQLNTFTGTALSKTISRQRGLHYISKKGNFMGFVAYNKDKKDLAIIFRGTILDREWVQNINGLGSAWNDSELRTQSVGNEGYGRDQISLALLEVKNAIGASLCINLAAAVGLTLFFSTFYHSASEFLATDRIVGGDVFYSILKGYVDIFARFFDWIPSGDLLGEGTDLINKLLSLFGGINLDGLLPLFDIAKYFIKNTSLAAILVSVVNSIVSGTVANVLVWGLFSRVLILVSAFSKKEKVFQTGFSELYTTDPDDGEYTRSPQKVVYDALYKYLADPAIRKEMEVKTITTSGHSLGSSLAVIAAHHVGVTVKALSQDFQKFPSIPVRCVTFACPKVASAEVFKSFPQLNIQHYHYLNRGDIVPMAMTGIFTNGLGFDNNHVLRLDPANLDRPLEPSSPSLLASVPRGVWGLGDAAALVLFLQYTVGESIAAGFRSTFGYPDPESRGVMKESKLKKIAWPIGNLLGGVVSKNSYFKALSLLGFEDETSVFVDAMGDWHNNEHIMYNMLVEVFRADPSYSELNVRPELSLINYDGDRISRNIDAVRSHPFVGPKFVPIRSTWFNAYRTEGQRQVVINRTSDDSVLAEMLYPQNIDLYASEYRKIFLHNLEKFDNVTTK